MLDQQDMEFLPEDPVARFVEIEERCRRKYEYIIGGEENGAVIFDAKWRYMATVVSAAKFLKIKPMSSYPRPRINTWDDNNFDEFISELEYFKMWYKLESLERESSRSIVLQGPTKDRVLTLTRTLRDEVNKLHIPRQKLDRLMQRLDEFDSEIETRKVTFATVAGMVLVIASAIANVGQSVSTVKDLVHMIEAEIGTAKDEQDNEAVALMYEREQTRLLPGPSEASPDAKASEDVDDEIPF